jgi:replicative DNA helicase
LLTESFLNSCFSLVLCKKTNIKRGKYLYRDIIDILDYQKNQSTLDIPVIIENKFECLKQICFQLMNDKSISTAIDSIFYGEKYKEFEDFISEKLNEELPEHVSLDYLEQIKMRKKIKNMFGNYDKLENLLDSVREGDFETIDDIVSQYENSIKELYISMMEENRNMRINAASSLDLVKDSYEGVIEMIKKKYDRENKTPTGYAIFDNTVFFGGFDPSRLYVLAGGSGSGKSTLLCNWFIKSASQRAYFEYNKENKNIKKIYVYITMENTIEESLVRMYQCMFCKEMKDVLQDIKDGVDIKEKILEVLDKNNSTIIMKYYPGGTIGVSDLMGILDDIKSEYPNGRIMALGVDYLDLLISDVKYDIYRLELGYISLALKVLAVQYNIPVIVPTQMNKMAYRVTNAMELTLDGVGESMKKVDHADFVMLMATDMNNSDLVHGRIGKNRCGPKGLCLGCATKFEYSKFTNIYQINTDEKKDKKSKKSKQSPFSNITMDDFCKMHGSKSKEINKNKKIKNIDEGI